MRTTSVPLSDDDGKTTGELSLLVHSNGDVYALLEEWVEEINGEEAAIFAADGIIPYENAVLLRDWFVQAVK